MTAEELAQQRAALWLRPVHTLEDAREFLAAVGFCLIYPVKPPLVIPTFIGAVLGTGENLPTATKAAVDPRTRDANELIARLLQEKSAFEVSYANHGSLLVAAAEFPYAFALLADRNLRQPPSAGIRGEKSLLRHTFEHLQAGPLTEQELLSRLGKSISEAALARALHELWSHLRVVRVDLRADGSPVWQVLYDWAPEAVKRGIQVSTAEALSALISRYLTTVIAAEQRDIEEFFGNLTARSKVAEVVRALLQAREFETVQIEGKRLVALTGAVPPSVLMPHPAGEAPPDLHESHKRNEQRRHKPAVAQLARPSFAVGYRAPDKPGSEPRSGGSDRPEQRSRPDQRNDRFPRHDRQPRTGSGRPPRDARPGERSDRGGAPSGRPQRGAQGAGRPERGGASGPSGGFKPAGRGNRKFSPRDKSERREGGSQTFGRAGRSDPSRPPKDGRPGDRRNRKFPSRGRSSRPSDPHRREGGGPSRPPRGPRSDRPTGRKSKGPDTRSSRPKGPSNDDPQRGEPQQ
jgi:23S rRNA pseudouridine2605 synthase